MPWDPNLDIVCPHSIGQNQYRISTVGSSNNTATEVVKVTDKKIVSVLTRAKSTLADCKYCCQKGSNATKTSPPNISGNEKGGN